MSLRVYKKNMKVYFKSLQNYGMNKTALTRQAWLCNHIIFLWIRQEQQILMADSKQILDTLTKIKHLKCKSTTEIYKVQLLHLASNSNLKRSLVHHVINQYFWTQTLNYKLRLHKTKKIKSKEATHHLSL